MPNIGPVELAIIVIIALIVVGPGKLPDVGAALGKSIREFRKAATDVKDSTRLDPLPETNQASAPAAPPAPTSATAPAPVEPVEAAAPTPAASAPAASAPAVPRVEPAPAATPVEPTPESTVDSAAR